jgi:hypothetical protein
MTEAATTLDITDEEADMTKPFYMAVGVAYLMDEREETDQVLWENSIRCTDGIESIICSEPTLEKCKETANEEIKDIDLKDGYKYFIVKVEPIEVVNFKQP